MAYKACQTITALCNSRLREQHFRNLIQFHLVQLLAVLVVVILVQNNWRQVHNLSAVSLTEIVAGGNLLTDRRSSSDGGSGPGPAPTAPMMGAVCRSLSGYIPNLHIVPSTPTIIDIPRAGPRLSGPESPGFEGALDADLGIGAGDDYGLPLGGNLMDLDRPRRHWGMPTGIGVNHTALGTQVSRGPTLVRARLVIPSTLRFLPDVSIEGRVVMRANGTVEFERNGEYDPEVSFSAQEELAAALVNMFRRSYCIPAVDREGDPVDIAMPFRFMYVEGAEPRFMVTPPDSGFSPYGAVTVLDMTE